MAQVSARQSYTIQSRGRCPTLLSGIDFRRRPLLDESQWLSLGSRASERGFEAQVPFGLGGGLQGLCRLLALLALFGPPRSEARIASTIAESADKGIRPRFSRVLPGPPSPCAAAAAPFFASRPGAKRGQQYARAQRPSTGQRYADLHRRLWVKPIGSTFSPPPP
jgi:hypothetical protein